MRLFKFFAILSAFVLAMGVIQSAQAVIVDNYSANSNASMGHGRENAAATNNLTSNYVRATGWTAPYLAEEIVTLNFGASVPTDQTIVSATLTLQVMSFAFSDGSSGTGVDLPVYALTSSFDGTATSWNQRDGTNSWASAGAKHGVDDYDATTETVTRVFKPTGATEAYTWDVTSLIQSQYDNGTLSLGILVGGRDVGTDPGGPDHNGGIPFAGHGGGAGSCSYAVYYLRSSCCPRTF